MGILFTCSYTIKIWTTGTIVYGNTIKKTLKDGQKNYSTWQTIELDEALETTCVNTEYGSLRITTLYHKRYPRSFKNKNTMNRQN